MKKQKRKLKINKLIIIFLFIFMICLGMIFFIKSDFFNLKNIKIINNDILTKTEIKKLSNIELNKNLFSYDTKKIKLNINQSMYIEDVQIKRNIPNSIIINVKEKEILCILKDKYNDYYYIDKNLDYIDKIDYKKIKNNYSIVEADFIIKDNKINFEDKKDKEKIISILKDIKKYGLNNEINSIAFLNKNKINMKTKQGIKIIINKNGDLEHDICKLTQILIDLKSKNINYGKIDMTFAKYTLYTYQ